MRMNGFENKKLMKIIEVSKELDNKTFLIPGIEWCERIFFLNSPGAFTTFAERMNLWDAVIFFLHWQLYLRLLPRLF